MWLAKIDLFFRWPCYEVNQIFGSIWQPVPMLSDLEIIHYSMLYTMTEIMHSLLRKSLIQFVISFFQDGSSVVTVNSFMPIAPVFGVKHTDVTLPLWPLNVSKHFPETVLQSFVAILEAVSTCSPFEKKVAVITCPSLFSKVLRHLPVSVHQTRALRSEEAVSSCWLSEEKAANLNFGKLSTSLIVRWHWSNGVVQTLITKQKSAVIICFPSSEISAVITLWACASMVRAHSPESMLQSFAVASALAVSNDFLSGEKIAELILPSWP